LAQAVSAGLEHRQTIGLVGAEMASVPGVDLLSELAAEAGGRLSPSSLKADCVTPRLAAALVRGRNRSATIAPEAGSERMRRVINKNLGAKGVLINITGSHDLSLHEVNEAATLIQEEAHEDANIIFGAVIDERMGDEIRITVIATGFGEVQREVKKPGFSLAREREAAASLRTPPARSAVPRDRDTTRPVVHMGTIIDDLESPTWQRPKMESAAANGSAERPEEFTITEEGEDQYEIPAFLRKNVDVTPAVIAVSPDNARLYVTNERSKTLSVISTATMSVVNTVALNDPPGGIALTPDGRAAYIASYTSVMVLDTTTNTVTATIPVGEFLGGIAIADVPIDPGPPCERLTRSASIR